MGSCLSKRSPSEVSGDSLIAAAEEATPVDDSKDEFSQRSNDQPSFESDAQPVSDLASLLPRNETDISRSMFVIRSGFVARAIQEGFPVMALSSFAQNELGATPEENESLFSSFGFVTLLPFCMKPVLGLLSDVCPIISAERRRPYMIVGMIGVGCASFFVATMVTNIVTLGACHIIHSAL